MKEKGIGKDYQYNHDFSSGSSRDRYFPSSQENRDFYHPVERGQEREMKKRLPHFEKIRKQKKGNIKISYKPLFRYILLCSQDKWYA